MKTQKNNSAKSITMVSLDTSTTETGYAIWNNGQLINWGTVTAVADKSELENNAYKNAGLMIEQIHSLLDKIKIDILIIEGLNVFNNPKTQEGQSDIIGACRGYAIERDIWYDRLSPNEWRGQVANGNTIPRKRKDCKPWDLKRMEELYPQIDVNGNDNIADAILIGEAYKQIFS